MRVAAFACIVGLSACGSSGGTTIDAHPGSPGTIDASPGQPGTPDAPPGSPGTPDAPRATYPAQCQSYAWTVVESDGSKLVETYGWAVFSQVHQDDSFVVTQCEPNPYAQQCPSGATCSGSTTPSLSSFCSVSTSTGIFFDNNLAISCGVKIDSYNAAGTLISTSGTVQDGSGITVTK